METTSIAMSSPASHNQELVKQPQKFKLNNFTKFDGILHDNLLEFFSDTNNFMEFYNIVDSTKSNESGSKISLRLLDWLATNYSKEYKVIYLWKGETVNLFNLYKNKLKSYGKKYFDPFKRRNRITFTPRLNDELVREHNIRLPIQTTLGQLKFFEWIIEDGVLQYAKDHVKEIEADMRRRTGGGISEKPAKVTVEVKPSKATKINSLVVLKFT